MNGEGSTGIDSQSGVFAHKRSAALHRQGAVTSNIISPKIPVNPDISALSQGISCPLDSAEARHLTDISCPMRLHLHPPSKPLKGTALHDVLRCGGRHIFLHL